MRIVNYLFDRGVSMPFYAKLMADMFSNLREAIPAVQRGSPRSTAPIDTFNKMFDQTKTIAFPDLSTLSKTEFEDKVCTWNKQKELRRGFGVFAAELHVRGLISEDLLHEALETVLSDFTDNIQEAEERDGVRVGGPGRHVPLRDVQAVREGRHIHLRQGQADSGDPEDGDALSRHAFSFQARGLRS